MGRPTIRTDELEDEILSRLACGESLKDICSEDDKPNIGTVIRWLSKDETFAQRYARAREMQAEVLADQMLEIADDGTNDWMAKRDREGNLVGWQLNGEAVARSKLRLEQRRWYAEKLRPKVYGAKVAVGGDPDAPPIKTTHQLDVSNLTLEELDVLGSALQKSLTKDE